MYWLWNAVTLAFKKERSAATICCFFPITSVVRGKRQKTQSWHVQWNFLYMRWRREWDNDSLCNSGGEYYRFWLQILMTRTYAWKIHWKHQRRYTLSRTLWQYAKTSEHFRSANVSLKTRFVGFWQYIPFQDHTWGLWEISKNVTIVLRNLRPTQQRCRRNMHIHEWTPRRTAG